MGCESDKKRVKTPLERENQDLGTTIIALIYSFFTASLHLYCFYEFTKVLEQIANATKNSTILECNMENV